VIRLRAARPQPEYPEDVAQLVAACVAQGYEVSPGVAEWAWRQYSALFNTCWLGLGLRSPDKLVAIMLRYCEPE
jgi:hypothetical protein